MPIAMSAKCHQRTLNYGLIYFVVHSTALPAPAIDTDLLAGLRERRACFCATENQEFILPAEPNVAVRVTRG